MQTTNTEAKGKSAHFFEFMDLDWLPKSLRLVLREILELGNAKPFRSYYDWVTQQTTRIASEKNVETILELGAGTAPISRHYLKLSNAAPTAITMRPCDINPDIGSYRRLQEQSEGRVEPFFTPVDFTRLSTLNVQNSVLLFSANFHHLNKTDRVPLLKSLLKQNQMVVIAEPLHRSLSSYLFVFGSLLPALLLPLALIHRPGRLERFVWCWLVPVAPIMFVWDGLASAIRQWSQNDWNQALFQELNLKPTQVQFQRTFFSEIVVIDQDMKSA